MLTKSTWTGSLLQIAITCTVLATSASTSWGARGRVQVKNSLLLTDKGTLMRGGSTHESMSTSDMRKWATEYGLNCFRVLMMSNADATGGWAVGDARNAGAISLLDALVNAAGEAGLYIIIDNHGGDPGSGDGKYNVTQIVNFWKYIAPRYKDRTHVMYEVKNEPYSWGCAGNESGREAMRKGYETIRAAAPNTHVFVWSFANLASCMPSEVRSIPSIDFRNATVAFHWYNGGSESTIRATLDKGVSLMCTEMKDHDNTNHDLATANKDMISRVSVLEKCKVGWTLFRFPSNADPTRRLATIKAGFNASTIKWVPDYGSWPQPAGGATAIALAPQSKLHGALIRSVNNAGFVDLRGSYRSVNSSTGATALIAGHGAASIAPLRQNR